ncbi:MAG TPA: YciI family protein [Candidatus Acidoferrales bacterium]|jgi:hypothetical protein|nr:YciI family protein [Candidatus Acidoferrales bacterium]
MKFFMKTTPDVSKPPTPPPPELMAEMASFIEESFRNGTLVATGAMDPRTKRIEHTGGSFTITDGPFSEAKEAVVGWAIVNAGSVDEAIELSKRFWRIVGDGTGTIQRVYDPGEMPPQFEPERG